MSRSRPRFKDKRIQNTSKIARAEQKYRHPIGNGRPLRRLTVVDGQAGLFCIQCGQAKPLKEFGFSHAKRLYFESMCRSCKKQYHHNRRKKGS